MLTGIFRGTPGRVFIIICAMYFIEYIDRVNVSVAAPLLKSEFHFSNTQLGLAFSAFGYSYALFQIIAGWAGDRIGPRKMLTISGLMWAAGTLATGLVGGMVSLFAARFVVGLGEAGTIPNATRAMSHWVARTDRGFAAGFTHSAARAAAAITPPLVVLMLPWVGWRGTFVALGALSLVWVVIWAVYFRDDPRDHSAITAEELARLPLAVDRSLRPAVPWGPLIRRITPVTLVFFCHAWTLWLYLSWLPSFFVASFGIDLKTSAIFSAGVFFAGMLGDTAGGLLTDAIYRRTGDLNKARRNAIVIGFTGSLVFMSCVLVYHNQTFAALCLAASLFFLEMTEGPVWAVPIDITPDYAGIAGGFISTAAGLAAVISPFAFGLITDLTGSYTVPFVLSIMLLFAGVVLAFYIRPDRPLVVGGVGATPLVGNPQA